MSTTVDRASSTDASPSRGSAVATWLKGQYPLYILVALLIIASVASPAFLSATNLTNLALQMSIIGVVVLAELIVVLTGGIDISVGSTLGLAAVLSAGMFGGNSLVLALVVAVVVGAVIGAINGWLVAYRGLEPFIVTLGMLALARGLVYAYGEGIPILPGAADRFADLGQTTVLGIPVLTIIWIVAIAVIAFLLGRTVWGRRVYAVGSNIDAARSSGVPVRATLWSVYILAGVLVGLGGWMFINRFASGTALAGNLMELEAIAAVVIGGARLSGGYGRVFGAVVGTIIFQVIANLLSLLNVSTFLQDAFRGALILVAITLATVSFSRRKSTAGAGSAGASNGPAVGSGAPSTAEQAGGAGAGSAGRSGAVEPNTRGDVPPAAHGDAR